MAESLMDIKKAPVEKVLAGLKDEDPARSQGAGRALARNAAKFGLGVKDYLTLAIETRGTQFSDLSGYELALVHLNLPVRDDFKEGVVLQAASDTFQTYPGTRILFPPVIDDMLYFTRRIDMIEKLEPMLAVSRTIAGAELLFTVANDDGSEYKSFVIPEMARIPIRSIRTSETSVRMYKHGSGIRTSYEFSRRARLDVLTPFAARVARELELSKIGAAVAALINGDGGTTPAATVVAQSSFNSSIAGTPATAGLLNYRSLLYWLVQRAKAGVPVDTVIGNWDAYFQWISLFQPVIAGWQSPAALVKDGTGIDLRAPSVLPGPVQFAVASAVPEGQLIGITRSETMEELREAAGDIAEEEREVLNQTITYIRTGNTGYRLIYKDTRQVFNYNA